MASFTFEGHQRANKRDNTYGSKFFGKGHFRLVNNTSVDIHYSPNGSDYFVLPKKQLISGASNYWVSEITLFCCERLVIEESNPSASGSFLVSELPTHAFTSVNYKESKTLY